MNQQQNLRLRTDSSQIHYGRGLNAFYWHAIDYVVFKILKKVSEYDQEIQESYTADQPTAP